MCDKKETLKHLMTKIQFSDNEQKTMIDTLEKVYADKVAGKWFSTLLAQYDASEHCNYKQMLSDVKALGEALDIHEYTMVLLLYLCMAEKLRQRYQERGLSEKLFYDTIMDFRYKLTECQLIYGVDGCFVGWWMNGYFELDRFALGRLQFEIRKTDAEYTVQGVVLPAGTKTINIHIPRTGTPLHHHEVWESYRMAYELFAGELTDQPVVFSLKSWLADPWNMTVLSSGSNIYKFISDFKIVESGLRDNYNLVWQLFDCLYTGDPEKLPRDTSFRRAYADRIARGEPVGWGYGLFIYKP